MISGFDKLTAGAFPLPPAPGFADVQGSRVLFTPPSAAVPILRTDKQWHAEPIGRGCAILRDEHGNSWGTFADAAVCESTAERLSR